MKLPQDQIVNKNKHLRKPLDSPSVWCGNFSELFLGFRFSHYIRRSYHMKKEYTIVIDISKEQEKLLDDIRWQHIDIDKMIQEEIREEATGIILSVMEGVRHGI